MEASPGQRHIIINIFRTVSIKQGVWLVCNGLYRVDTLPDLPDPRSSTTTSSDPRIYTPQSICEKKRLQNASLKLSKSSYLELCRNLICMSTLIIMTTDVKLEHWKCFRFSRSQLWQNASLAIDKNVRNTRYRKQSIFNLINFKAFIVDINSTLCQYDNFYSSCFYWSKEAV